MGNNVRLSWLKDPNADSYIIQKESIDEFGKHVAFEPITMQQISYLDSEVAIDMTYVYRLDKVRGSITYKGIETSIYSLMRDTPFPDIIVASYLGDKALLSWKHDANADSYLIQKQSIDTNNNIVDLLPISTDKTSYIDSAVAKDMVYIYRLDKIRGGTTYEGISLTTFSTTRPDPFPGVIVAESLSDGKAAHLSWEPDIGADAYRVMRALNKLNDQGKFEWLNRSLSIELQMLSDVSAVDTKLEDDKSYVYRLDKQRNSDDWIIGNQVTVFSWNRPPPFDEAPVVNSFRSEKTIQISWNTDIGADIYKLERRENNISGWLSWGSIYQGTELIYEDTTAEFEDNAYKRYEYRLTKIRNGIEYVPQYDTTLAVAVATAIDPHEPNDDYLNATLLDYPIDSNIYFFRFTDGRLLEDKDWYKISIPAGKIANLKIHYIPPAYSSMLKIYEPSKLERPFPEGSPITVKNEAAVQQFVYFAIIPDRNNFASGVGGDIICYTLYWDSIVD
jgi:hypothetical protein